MEFKIFRFDDVCVNSDMKLHNKLTDIIYKRHPRSRVIWAVSPMVQNTGNQRVFHESINPKSDHYNHFDVDKLGIPDLRPDVVIASHGLIHVDHRLLSYDEQHFSIRVSASLLQAKMFVPPFNKWNQETELICQSLGIKLIKFESGWLSMEHNKFDDSHEKYYLHGREWTVESLTKWLR